MPRRVRGVLAVEDSQTGDGRVIAAGACTWVDPPLPLAWLVDGDQHVMPTEAPQIGIIETITRDGNSVAFTGQIDDAQPDGAEAVRRMEAGIATNGNRFGVSIDPDDYEVEIIDRSGDVAELVMVASGTGAPPRFIRSGVTAAAGEADPTDGEVVMEDSSDSVIERYTALRIRGATLCAVAAFAEAYVELDDTAAAEPAPVVEGETVAAAATSGCGCGGACITCSTVAGSIYTPSLRDIMRRVRAEHPDLAGVTAAAPVAPPSAWFDDPRLSQPTPLTVTDEGRVFGHLAAPWGACHTGVADRCVMPPRSAAAYAYFTTGAILTADGTQRRVGQLTMGTGHAPLTFDHRAAAAHYDGGSGALQWADVAVGEDAHGVWVAGAMRPGLRDTQVREARALALSGDWRSIGGHLELVAALSVPVPGFPVVPLAASATPLPFTRARIDHGTTLALVAAGVVVPAPPWQAAMDEMRREVHAELGLLRRNLELLAPLGAERVVAAMRAEAGREVTKKESL